MGARPRATLIAPATFLRGSTLTEEDREAIYARIDLAEYPRRRGEGARMAAPEIDAAIRPLMPVSA